MHPPTHTFVQTTADFSAFTVLYPSFYIHIIHCNLAPLVRFPPALCFIFKLNFYCLYDGFQEPHFKIQPSYLQSPTKIENERQNHFYPPSFSQSFPISYIPSPVTRSCRSTCYNWCRYCVMSLTMTAPSPTSCWNAPRLVAK